MDIDEAIQKLAHTITRLKIKTEKFIDATSVLKLRVERLEADSHPPMAYQVCPTCAALIHMSKSEDNYRKHLNSHEMWKDAHNG